MITTDQSRDESQRPIRVLHIATIMNRGGLETMLMNYYRHIDRSSLQFDFMVHRHERGAYDDEIESLGGKIYRVHPIHPKYFLAYPHELNRFFKEHHEYKIVHSHLDLLSTFVLRSARENGVPVRISHSHNSSFPDSGARRLFKLYSRRRLNAECTHFFACSESAGRFQFGDNIVDSGQLTVMRNAIDTNKFKFNVAARSHIREELNLEDKFVIGHVGRFSYQKNHDFIIKVFREVARTERNAFLLLVGDGELRGAIENKVAGMGLSDKVIFIGSVPNVNDYLSAMDVFLFPSHFEGLGIVVIEAQASGLPVVASTMVPRDVSLTPNVTFLALEAPLECWADAVCNCKTFNRTNDANTAVAKAYGIENSAKLLENFYEEVLDDHNCFYACI